MACSVWAQGSARQAYWSVAVYTSLVPLILSPLLTHACSSPVHPDPLPFSAPGPSTKHPMISRTHFHKMSDGKFYTNSVHLITGPRPLHAITPFSLQGFLGRQFLVLTHLSGFPTRPRGWWCSLEGTGSTRSKCSLGAPLVLPWCSLSFWGSSGPQGLHV